MLYIITQILIIANLFEFWYYIDGEYDGKIFE